MTIRTLILVIWSLVLRLPAARVLGATLGITLLGLRTVAAAEMDLPVVDSPAAMALVRSFSENRERLLSKSFSRIPSQIVQNACQPPASLPYRIAELFDQHPDLRSEQDAARRAARRRARAEGQDPDALPKMTVSNVTIIPIEIGCTNGLADGPYVAHMSFDRKIEVMLRSASGDKVITGNSTTKIQTKSRIETELRHGQPSGMSAMYSISRSKTESRFDDQEFDKLMRKSDREAARNLSEEIVSAYFTSPEGRATFTFVKMPRPSKGGKTSWVDVLQSSFEYSLDEHRIRIETYHGTQLVLRSTLRDDKLHGEKISYTENFYKPLKIRLEQVPGMENSREVSIEGRELIETRLCYQNGEQVKIASCPES